MLAVFHLFIIQVVVKFFALKSAINEQGDIYYVLSGRRIIKDVAATKQDIDNQLDKVQKKEVERESRDLIKGQIFGTFGSGIFEERHSMLFNFLFGKRKFWH